MRWHPMCARCGWRMGGLDSYNGVACRCGKTEWRDLETGSDVALDAARPVRVSELGLRANPQFVGLTGSVTHARAHSLSVYFPERGAASVWLHGEIENVPLPPTHDHDERTK